MLNGGVFKQPFQADIKVERRRKDLRFVGSFSVIDLETFLRAIFGTKNMITSAEFEPRIEFTIAPKEVVTRIAILSRSNNLVNGSFFDTGQVTKTVKGAKDRKPNLSLTEVLFERQQSHFLLVESPNSVFIVGRKLNDINLTLLIMPQSDTGDQGVPSMAN